ncbi:MAG: CDP-glycerol glycerophosphotransferase family protein [Prevotella sp.]|nr:CDP-glycerol glycerophosphotransferase family protein [Prevotella sp.]
MEKFINFIRTNLRRFHIVLEIIVIWCCKKFLPIKKKNIIFRSTPDFSDNARALAEYMVEKNYTEYYNIFFDVKNPQKYKDVYKDSPIVFFSSMNPNGTYKLKHLKLIHTANYLMSTHEMIVDRNYGRKDQHYIRLWHGCSYKDRSSRDGHNIRNFDIALVPGPLFIKTKAYFWNVDEKYILAKGYPRYDWMLKKDDRAVRMAQKYKKNDNTRIILWMPTYRVDKNGKFNDTKEMINFPIVQQKKDWTQLDSVCKDNNIIILIKLHPFQKEYNIPFDTFESIKEIDNSDFEKEDVQLYCFLSQTDALITDYSSVAFDYLLVDKPIGFTLDDYKDYKDSRGFIFDNPLEFMPGHHLYNFNDMITFLKDIGMQKDPHKEKRNEVRSCAITPSTHYCLDLLDYLNIKKDTNAS